MSEDVIPQDSKSIIYDCVAIIYFHFGLSKVGMRASRIVGYMAKGSFAVLVRARGGWTRGLRVHFAARRLRKGVETVGSSLNGWHALALGI